MVHNVKKNLLTVTVHVDHYTCVNCEVWVYQMNWEGQKSHTPRSCWQRAERSNGGMVTDIGVLAGSLLAVSVKPLLDWFSFSLSSSLGPSHQLDHSDQSSPSSRCCGLEGSRRFLGPAGRLNCISIHQPLMNTTQQSPGIGNLSGISLVTRWVRHKL